MNNLVILEGIILYLNWRLKEQFLHLKLFLLDFELVESFNITNDTASHSEAHLD